VERVLPNSPWLNKIREGDTIRSMGSYAVPNARTLAFLMEKAEPGQELSIGLLRDYGQNHVVPGRIDVTIPALQ
jgi:S1-C subfamily serine protease